MTGATLEALAFYFLMAIAATALLAGIANTLRLRSIRSALDGLVTGERDIVQEIVEDAAPPLRRCLIRAGRDGPAKVHLEWRAFRPGISLLTPRVLAIPDGPPSPSSFLDPLDFDRIVPAPEERQHLEAALAKAMRRRLGPFWRLRMQALRNYALVALPAPSRHDVIAALRESRAHD